MFRTVEGCAKETLFVWKFVQTVVVHKHIRDQYRETTWKQKGILVWKSLYFFFLIGWGVGGGGDGDGVSHFTVERIQFRRQFIKI